MIFVKKWGQAGGSEYFSATENFRKIKKISRFYGLKIEKNKHKISTKR